MERLVECIKWIIVAQCCQVWGDVIVGDGTVYLLGTQMPNTCVPNRCLILGSHSNPLGSTHLSAD